MATGESSVLFEISSDGKVVESSMHRVCSTSGEMLVILEEVVPHVQKYFEFLVKKALTEKKKGGI